MTRRGDRPGPQEATDWTGERSRDHDVRAAGVPDRASVAGRPGPRRSRGRARFRPAPARRAAPLSPRRPRARPAAGARPADASRETAARARRLRRAVPGGAPAGHAVAGSDPRDDRRGVHRRAVHRTPTVGARDPRGGHRHDGHEHHRLARQRGRHALPAGRAGPGPRRSDRRRRALASRLRRGGGGAGATSRRDPRGRGSAPRHRGAPAHRARPARRGRPPNLGDQPERGGGVVGTRDAARESTRCPRHHPHHLARRARRDRGDAQRAPRSRRGRGAGAARPGACSRGGRVGAGGGVGRRGARRDRDGCRGQRHPDRNRHRGLPCRAGGTHERGEARHHPSRARADASRWGRARSRGDEPPGSHAGARRGAADVGIRAHRPARAGRRRARRARRRPRPRGFRLAARLPLPAPVRSETAP